MNSSTKISSDIFLSLVIPCYNEEKRIASLLRALEEFEKKIVFLFEIVIIDDGSNDKTIDIINTNEFIKKLISEKKCIVHAKKHAGKGEALRKGIELASGDFILTMDADVAAHPIEILKWVEKEKTFNEHTIYIGSREHSESIIESGFTRKFAGRVFNFIVRIITGLSLKDTQCGFKLYPQSAGKKIFAELKNSGWAHDIELLMRGKMLGYSIKEMPLKWNSIEGSKISVMRDSFKMLIETIKIKQLLKR